MTVPFQAESVDASSLEGEPELISWLDLHRFAFGKFSLLEGDPSLSKSTIMLDIAGRGSLGAPMLSGLVHEPFDTLIIGVEDGTRDTLVPRAMAVGGDRSRIIHLRSVRNDDGTREPFSLPKHIPYLDRFYQKLPNLRLVVFDPLPSLLDRGLNNNSTKDVRQGVEPAVDWAQDRGVCLIGLRHFTKAGNTNPLYRGEGSIAFTALARTVCQVYADEDGGFVLTSAKNNLGPLAPSVAYDRESVSYAAMGVHDPTGINSAPRIVWHGLSGLSARDLSNGPQSQEDRQERDEAIELVRGMVATGQNSWAQIVKQGRADGLSVRALTAARAKLGLVKRRGGGRNNDGYGEGSSVTWHFPADPDRMPVCGQCNTPRDPEPGPCPKCEGRTFGLRAREEM